jgi:hypothetical protein
MFSFLRRKTDFFDGPNGKGTDPAIQKVMEVIQKHADMYRRDKLAAAAAKYKQQQQKSAAKPNKGKSTTPKSTSAKKEDDDVIELGNDGKFDVSSTKETNAGIETVPVPVDAASTSSTSSNNDESSNENDDEL